MLEAGWVRRPEWVEQGQVILTGIGGSHAFGTVTNQSDVDFVSVYFPAIEYVLGLRRADTYHNKSCGWCDITIYPLHKFFRLLLKNNPTVLEVLWLPRDCYTVLTNVGEILIAHRHYFLSKKIAKTFGGYAMDQLRKAQGISRSQHGRRNDLIEKFGWDTRNGSHLIRVLEEGIEALETGEIRVRRPNADFLKLIKNGKYSLEEVVGLGVELFDKLNKVLKVSVLPDEPDYDMAEKLLVDIQRDYYC